MVKPQSGFSTPPSIKEEKYFVQFVLTILWCVTFVIYSSKVDTTLPSMSFLQ